MHEPCAEFCRKATAVLFCMSTVEGKVNQLKGGPHLSDHRLTTCTSAS